MTESDSLETQNADGPRFRGSIRRSLLGWFLLLSILPLFVLSVVGYLQARNELTSRALHELEVSADAEVRFLRNWLDFRFRDLQLQAQAETNARLLERLREAWRESSSDLEGFVRSYEWARIVDGPQRDFATLLRTYDYLHDVLLLDTEGNILFTVARERDLGTNLFSSASFGSGFARRAREALETGEPQMSDLEHYAPSNGFVTSFLTAPIEDVLGDTIGVVAIRIRVDHMLDDDGLRMDDRESVHTYVVGEDGLLRTSLRPGRDDGVLATRIQTELFRVWRGENEDATGHTSSRLTQATLPATYVGPLGRKVIGVGRPLERGKLNWLIVSEIDERQALLSVHKLGVAMLVLLSLTMVSIVGVAIIRARHITEPLVALTNFSRNVARGQLDEELAVTTEDEVGELVHAFNQMITARREQEHKLRESVRSAREAQLAIGMRAAELELANQELDAFAYIASHDLKEPLRGIHNYARFLLEDHAADLDEEGLRMLSALPHLSQRLDGLLDSLLRYSASGRKDPVLAQVDIHEIVLRETRLRTEDIEAAGVEIRIIDRLPTLECDSAVAGDVFRELLDNALQYNDKPRRWIEIGTRPSADFATLHDVEPTPVFYVRDNGIGISQKHLRTIFRIFKRLHVRDHFGSGSGAGLTILEKLLTRCGGRIWVESTPGEGSTFYFTLRGESS